MICVRKGSIILTLRLAIGQAERLRELIQNGILSEISLDSHVNIDTLQITNKSIPLLWNANRAVRLSAAKVLGESGRMPAMRCPGSLMLSRTTIHPSDPLPPRASGRIGSPEAVPLLGRLLRDNDTAVRGRAVEALGRIGSPEAVPLLDRLLGDKRLPSGRAGRGPRPNRVPRCGTPTRPPAEGQRPCRPRGCRRSPWANRVCGCGTPTRPPAEGQAPCRSRACRRGVGANWLSRCGAHYRWPAGG